MISPWMLVDEQTEFYTSDSKVAYKTFRNSFFYREFCQARNIHFASGGYVKGTKNSKCLLTLQRNFQQGSFDGEEIAYLNLLYPHIKNAPKLHEKFDVLKQEVFISSVSRLLNKLPWPVFIITDRLTVLNSNVLAEKLLEHSQDFKIKAKKLVFDPSALKMESFIQQISKQINTFSAPSQNILFKGKSTTYEVFCVPLDAENSFFTGAVDVKQFMLWINIHGVKNIDFTQKLKSLYCLTNAEAIVTNGIVNGLELDEIAQKNGLKYSTVKSYLRRTFQKTGTNKQHELVSKFMKNYIVDFV